MTVAQQTKTLQIRFGRPDTQVLSGPGGLVLDLSIPWLAGPAEEIHAAPLDAVEESVPGLHLLRGQEEIVGVAIEQVNGPLDLERATRDLFLRILRSAQGMHLCRVWNYVPYINAMHESLENYHRFNMGRWAAFHEALGCEFMDRLPAASAVGTEDWTLVSVFQATSQVPRLVENPQQMPAWKYPPCYGPKSPSFSRAASIISNGLTRAFISGTASIKGHQTVGSGDLAEQCAVTCENLRLICDSLSLPNPCKSKALPGSAKVYLRRAEDLDQVVVALEKEGGREFLRSATFLKCDICRTDLDVEIEITCSGIC